MRVMDGGRKAMFRMHLARGVGTPRVVCMENRCPPNDLACTCTPDTSPGFPHYTSTKAPHRLGGCIVACGVWTLGLTHDHLFSQDVDTAEAGAILALRGAAAEHQSIGTHLSTMMLHHLLQLQNVVL